MICCPGLDFCGLANASTISVYHDIYDRFESLDDQYDVGPIRITMSGCMNACGHHTVGHIGLLGVAKSGEQSYQVMPGGTPTACPTVGRLGGIAPARHDVHHGIASIVYTPHQRTPAPPDT